MPFEHWGYHFEGAYALADSLKSKAGVYVIWCERGGNWAVLDVGEAADVKKRVKNHERSVCWKDQCGGRVYYSATYTPKVGEADRMKIEERIRSLASPPCGEQ